MRPVESTAHGKFARWEQPGGLPQGGVRSVMVDRHGLVWVSANTGLFRSVAPVNYGGKAQFEQQFPPGTRGNERFLKTLEDAQGQVWAAGDLGLARWSQGVWTRYTKSDGLSADGVAQLAEDKDGSIWAGYRDAFGISHLSFPKTGSGRPTVTHYNTASGLHSDKSLFLVGFDNAGLLWVGTDHGLDVFDHAVWRHYGRSDGLVWDDCNTNAFFADAGGVWFGTSRGLAQYRRSAVAPPSVPPPVVFTSVKFGGLSADAGVPAEIPANNNSLRVRFAALTFVQESSVLFRYRMSSAAKAWVETAERELNYPNLPPGDYTLEVEARNAQGLWSAEPAQLSFQVLTPWWQGWGFRTGWGVAGFTPGAACYGRAGPIVWKTRRFAWRSRWRSAPASSPRKNSACSKRKPELSRKTP